MLTTIKSYLRQYKNAQNFNLPGIDTETIARCMSRSEYSFATSSDMITMDAMILIHADFAEKKMPQTVDAEYLNKKLAKVIDYWHLSGQSLPNITAAANQKKVQYLARYADYLKKAMLDI